MNGGMVKKKMSCSVKINEIRLRNTKNKQFETRIIHLKERKKRNWDVPM